ncbi:MAG TPA: CPBP family intramembrane glutamic endopeptidase [Candidatus Baltobacteraceae bacterium]|nr:CPBP family intramembrane glutamic endopeptidase [Candidatus Baltobacteraceae bacterium]
MAVFLGADGLLRPIWRAAIYWVVGSWILVPIAGRLFDGTAAALRVPLTLNPARSALSEILYNFLVALICTGIFALYERRRIDSYGLPVQQALGARTWEGMAAGVGLAGFVAVGMLAFGGMQIHGLATTGSVLVMYALAWLGANVCVGISEEFWYRSYFFQTLWKSVGFWPAAAVVALLFAGDHYFYKAGENVWDVVTLVSLSLLMTYSVLKTGTLWFAVGFHTAFDYMQLFVIGTPNGSHVPAGRLLDVTFHGPAWLTGGALGTEASFLMYPAIAALWYYVYRRNYNTEALR